MYAATVVILTMGCRRLRSRLFLLHQTFRSTNSAAVTDRRANARSDRCPFDDDAIWSGDSHSPTSPGDGLRLANPLHSGNQSASPIAREAYRLLFRPARLPASNFPPRYNVAPTDQIPIVRVDPRDDERELVMARWGLVPWWSKSMPKVPHINARAETVHEKALFSRGIPETSRAA